MSGACDIAWAAGLFEGEGCISQPRWPGRVSIALMVTSTDKDVLARFQQIVGYGNILEKPRKTKPSHYKTLWEWRIAKQPEVIRILVMLMPYFGNRRLAKAVDALKHTTPALGRAARQKQKTTCKFGHRLTPANTYVTPQGHRRCRRCRRRWKRDFCARAKVKAGRL